MFLYNIASFLNRFESAQALGNLSLSLSRQPALKLIVLFLCRGNGALPANTSVSLGINTPL